MTTSRDTLAPFSPQDVIAARGLTSVWVGLTEDCPLSRYRVGPITMMKESHAVVRDASGAPVLDGSGLTKVKYNDGKIENLAGGDILHIASRAMKIVVHVIDLPDLPRGDGTVETGRKRAHGIKTYSTGAQYTPDPSDVLLSDYVYLLPAEDAGRYSVSGASRAPTLTTNGEVTLPDFIKDLAKKAPKQRKTRTRRAPKKPAAVHAVVDGTDLVGTSETTHDGE